MALTMKTIRNLLSIHNEVSTTNLRIYATLFVVLSTAAYYFLTGNVPADSWLIFLAAMSGIDVGQYISKRTTFDPTVHQAAPLAQEEPVEDGTQSTDVRELSDTVQRG